MTAPQTRFTVHPGQVPAGPPESRGLTRDDVRLLTAAPGLTAVGSFRRLADLLQPGDLLVVNDSATLPAAIDGRRPDGRPVSVHLSTPLRGGEWLVELRHEGRVRDGQVGERVRLPGGEVVTVLAAAPGVVGTRLWRAALSVEAVLPYLRRYGRPIAYDAGRWPVECYQTVFAVPPRDATSASSEMPSAGRPFSPRVLKTLHARGVRVATVTLHTGVASLEAGEQPLPERFRVPAAAARAVNRTRRAGGCVVAVGTTVTRALETVARPDGTVRPGAGVTDLVLGPSRPAVVVNGLVTGWHDPDASHLLLLEAVAGPDLVAGAYAAALDARLLWHEFGDSCLLLPAYG